LDRKGVYRGLVGKPEGKKPFGKPKVDGKIILKWTFRKWDGSTDWIDLAQDRDICRALVNALKNFRVS
jgi:hypothetical protein